MRISDVASWRNYFPDRGRIFAAESRLRKPAIWVGSALLVLLVLVVAASFLLDHPLRRRMEADLNSRLKGYSVRIGRLDFHPFGFSLDLENSTIYQNEHPDPPIATIANLTASVHWKALLFGRLVADLEVDDPHVHIDLSQFTQEAKDEIPIKDKGWQDAVQAIYPLKINRFRIHNGDLTYADRGPFKPLHIAKIEFVAENIRNVESAAGSYPSPVRVEGVVFDTGKMTLDGRADFLAEPHVTVKADLKLDRITLDYFKPIAERYQFSIQQGTLSSDGNIEVAREGTRIEMRDISLDGLAGDYIHLKPTAPTKEIAKEVGKTTRKHSNDPTLEVKIDRLRVRKSRLGYINRAANPVYRVFFTDMDVDIQNLSSHFKNGPARGRATGRFMGSGPTQIEAAFRPESKGPDFNLVLSIEDTDMRRMNDLFRAYGNFDVVKGAFSFYSDLTVRAGKIDGYVKPMFRDMDVYDRRQDHDKSVFRKLYESLVGGLSGLLTNRPREEVATKTTVSGDIESPQTNTWEIVGRLVQNAFFRAILPGFDKEVVQNKQHPRAEESS
jgi:hypothetical protein